MTYWYRDHLRQGKKTVETVSRETLYWAHGAAHFAEGVSAHPLVWLAVDLHPEKGACAAAAASRSGRAAGVGDMWLWQVWHRQYGVVYDIEGPGGHVIREDTRMALCRCGQSNNKPFCDGTHRQIGFRTNPPSEPAQTP